jgi:hypothetical protein
VTVVAVSPASKTHQVILGAMQHDTFRGNPALYRE